jgi:hypothetical protein
VAQLAAPETCEQAHPRNSTTSEGDECGVEGGAGREALMRYRINQPWPVLGGSMLLPSGSIIDDSLSDFMRGVVPPPDSTPLDAATREWLIKSYQLPDHNHSIAAVEHSKQE